MVSIISARDLDYVIHIGIQRSILYALNNQPIHPNISMLLHKCAATYMLQHHPDKQFMVTNPLEHMEKIFINNLPNDAIHRISGRNLTPFIKKLELEQRDNSILRTFKLEAMEDNAHLAISLKVLSAFGAEPLPENQASAVHKPLFSPSKPFSRFNWATKHPVLVSGSLGFLLSLILITYCYRKFFLDNQMESDVVLNEMLALSPPQRR